MGLALAATQISNNGGLQSSILKTLLDNVPVELFLEDN